MSKPREFWLPRQLVEPNCWSRPGTLPDEIHVREVTPQDETDNLVSAAMNNIAGLHAAEKMANTILHHSGCSECTQAALDWLEKYGTPEGTRTDE